MVAFGCFVDSRVARVHCESGHFGRFGLLFKRLNQILLIQECCNDCHHSL